jgi:hypothetical protein
MEQTLSGCLMKTFIVHYNSNKNLFKSKRVIQAYELTEAQTKFLNWLKDQPVYSHLWQLEFQFEEVGQIQ